MGSIIIRGIKLELHDNEDLSNHIRRENDFFEPDILDYLRDHHNKQGTVLDIGANIGNHTAYFENFLDCGLIMAFEPVPDNFILLEKNVKSSICYNVAISASSHDNLGMVINRGNMGASQVDLHGDLRVDALAIDDLMLNNVTLMKIDVEEHEPAVLDGAKETIQLCKPLILIEDHYDQYAKLLPDYELEKGWPEHKTYLYRWGNA